MRSLRFSIALSAIIFAAAIIQGQQKPLANITPATTYTLNPEAAARWIELGKAEQEIIKEANRQLAEIQGQKQSILLGAGVPRDYEPLAVGASVTFKAKEPKPVLLKAKP